MRDRESGLARVVREGLLRKVFSSSHQSGEKLLTCKDLDKEQAVKNRNARSPVAGTGLVGLRHRKACQKVTRAWRAWFGEHGEHGLRMRLRGCQGSRQT